MNGAALAGPAIGGTLYAVRALAHAVPFLFTAATFVIALISAIAMRFAPGAVGPPRRQIEAGSGSAARAGSSGSGNMFAGVRVLWDQPVLRAATVLIMCVNTISAGFELIIIVLLRHQAVPSGTIGLALGLGAAGGLAGAPLVPLLHRLRPGCCCWVCACSMC